MICESAYCHHNEQANIYIVIIKMFIRYSQNIQNFRSYLYDRGGDFSSTLNATSLKRFRFSRREEINEISYFHLKKKEVQMNIKIVRFDFFYL